MITKQKDAKQARRVAWLFGIGGIIIITAGILRLRGMLFSPFEFHPTASSGSVADLFATDASDPNRDTDQDGLLDRDEMANYGTSPYIADTDSDGIADGDEIKNNTNPLCPEGKECAQREATTPSTTVSPENLLGPNAASGNPGSLADLLGIDAVEQALTDPKAIREQLKAAGVSPAVLDKLDDAAVVELYQKTVQSSGATPSQIASASPTAGMTPQELRALLIRSGVDAKLLEKMTDEQVVQVVEETLKKK